MKRVFSILAIAVLSFAAFNSDAQIYVTVRPPRPAVVVAPAPPAPGRVWVDEDWACRGGRYVWHGGYWVAPPRPGVAWHAGYWDRRRGGYYWVPGHWGGGHRRY